MCLLSHISGWHSECTESVQIYLDWTLLDVQLDVNVLRRYYGSVIVMPCQIFLANVEGLKIGSYVYNGYICEVVLCEVICMMVICVRWFYVRLYGT